MPPKRRKYSVVAQQQAIQRAVFQKDGTLDNTTHSPPLQTTHPLPPPIITQPPPICLQPPPIITQPSPIITQPPPICLQPPPIITQPPPILPPLIRPQSPPIITQPPPILPPPASPEITSEVKTQDRVKELQTTLP